MHLVQRVCV